MLTSRSSLPVGRDVAPVDLFGPLRRRRLLGQQVVEVRAHEVAQEVLVTLARAAQQVGAPHEEQAREVARVVGVLHREAQRTPPELLDDVLVDRQCRPPPPRRPDRAGCDQTSDRSAASRGARPAQGRRSAPCRPAVLAPAARRGRRRRTPRSATGRWPGSATRCRSSGARGRAPVESGGQRRPARQRA